MNSQYIEKVWQPVREFPTKTSQYIKEVKHELERVSWPSKKEVIGTTIVVVLSVFFFGFYLFLVDLVLSNGLNRLFRYFGIK